MKLKHFKAGFVTYCAFVLVICAIQFFQLYGYLRSRTSPTHDIGRDAAIDIHDKYVEGVKAEDSTTTDTAATHGPAESQQETLESKAGSVEVNILETAMKINAKHGVVLLQLLNEGYLEMTKSWICNVKAFRSVVDRTMFITTDMNSYRTLVEFDPDLHVVYKEFTTQKDMSYGRYDYYDYTLLRIRLIMNMLNNNATVWVVESDAVWLADPTSLVLGTKGDIVTANDMPSPATCISAGFMLLRPTAATKSAFKRLIAKLVSILEKAKLNKVDDLGRSASEQLLLMDIAKVSRDLTLTYLPHYSFVPGLYYKDEKYRNLVKNPLVIQNNWIVGNAAKISRARHWRHWLLDNDNTTCIELKENGSF